MARADWNLGVSSYSLLQWNWGGTSRFAESAVSICKAVQSSRTGFLAPLKAWQVHRQGQSLGFTGQGQSEVGMQKS